ncbi:Signal recognition particle receptor subunit alpha-like protein isoform X2 [Oopsacas minuta]|uniref:Signal recognition particle receptor subunit alpha-like protein isoform X2 n=1 Tax=Oopsacas minuta TaxID=111878 RepID=A0AAV7KHG2_9METZ|nr:Signal recognition particle receptor subunit alpha-like protein isoform X2 [Oopsacas minuta]
MFDLFAIFTKGGILLWHYQQHAAVSVVRVVNELISQVILLERFHLATFSLGQLLLKFKLDNNFELIFVIAYQKIAKLMEIDRLIENLFSEFRNLFAERLKTKAYFDAISFDTIFKPILKAYEIENSNSISSNRTMKTFTESKKFSKLSETQKEKTISALEHKESNSNETIDETLNLIDSNSYPEDTSHIQTSFPRAIQGDRVGGARRGRGRSKNHVESKKIVPKKHIKVGRTWDGQISQVEKESLNYNKEDGPPDQTIDVASYVDPVTAVGGMRGDLSGIDTMKESDTKPTPKVSRFMSMLGGLTGSKPVGKDRLIPVLEAVKEHLITKNVAAEIAENLCASVGEQVEGRTLSTFTTVRSVVQQSLRDSLSQILMPRRNINVLREIITKRKTVAKPYVITFCGVNGVGKSTSLAKVCFWLLENDFRVLIAACDTFRSGAIEQLLTHTKCLQSLYPGKEGSQRVTLYSNKTNKDASSVATEGILIGIRDGYDVIMVDTAGRMQDNQPLMQALGKLIHRNTPDLVLFVGEALVGNEGVDQLQKFNQSLIDYSFAYGDSVKSSLIDGILLTKFDTIDDKVGAAISMTYATGHPIIFVGTGQMYTDLKSFSPESVMNALLK